MPTPSMKEVLAALETLTRFVHHVEALVGAFNAKPAGASVRQAGEEPLRRRGGRRGTIWKGSLSHSILQMLETTGRAMSRHQLSVELAAVQGRARKVSDQSVGDCLLKLKQRGRITHDPNTGTYRVAPAKPVDSPVTVKEVPHLPSH